MTITAGGPAGTAHNPFAGSARDVGDVPAFPAERYTAIGASEEEVTDLSSYYDSLSRQERRDAIVWHDEQTDDQLRESLDRFREARDAYAALGGLTDEQRAELEALTDEQRAELAELAQAQAASAAEKQAAYDELPQEDKDALAALTDEQRAELATLADAPPTTPEQAAYDALSQEDKDALAQLTEGQRAALDELNAPPVVEQAAPSGDGADEQPATFSTEQIADLRIDEVMELVDAGSVTAEAALAAETARGDDARPTLIKRLSAHL